MPSDVQTVTVTILGKEYQISCPPSEEEALRRSARYLDEQMTRIRSRGSTLGFEKIAVMAAINISHELLTKTQWRNESGNDTAEDLRQLEEKIDLALRSNDQSEI